MAPAKELVKFKAVSADPNPPTEAPAVNSEDSEDDDDDDDDEHEGEESVSKTFPLVPLSVVLVWAVSVRIKLAF